MPMNTEFKNERDFWQYLQDLQALLPHLIIHIAANNTPTGSYFLPQAAKLFCGCLGLTTDFSNLEHTYRRAYVAAIYRGDVIVEKLSKSQSQNINIELEYGDKMTVRLHSAGFEGNPERNLASIELNGENVSLNHRGLNFVVMDADSFKVIDSCFVDTWLSDFLCVRADDDVKLFNNYKNAHPEIQLVCFTLPSFPMSNLSENEAYLKNHGYSGGMVLENILKNIDELIKTRKLSLLDCYSEEGCLEVLKQPESYEDANGTRRFFDKTQQYINTVGGIRVTRYQPQKHKRAIFLVGSCYVFGVAASDEHTIASFLQKRLNEYAPEEGFIVHNYGYFLAGGLHEPFYDEYKILQSLPTHEGDIVMLLYNPKNSDVPLCDLRKSAKRPHSYGEVFFCVDHYAPGGYHMIADGLYDFLASNQFYRNSIQSPMSNKCSEMRQLTPNLSKELIEYQNELKRIYADIAPKIGAVVMNCNPFTLGHYYLVREALKQCDRLIVFVVEEDKSDFSFQDRIEMVRQGLADVKNTVIIPSGKFILSALTFREYFNKSDIQDISVDTSFDLTIFAKEIAPCLHISMRFVGSEPFDKITAQYNASMRSVLSSYGIEVVEIDRYSINGKIVSASAVRKLLAQKKWEEITSLVPKTTFDYLYNSTQ